MDTEIISPSEQRSRPDSIGTSIWPAGLEGIANLVPTHRGYVLVLAQLVGELAVGAFKIRPGEQGIFPMPDAVDMLPLTYRFSHPADTARVVFVTQ